ncbi:hypothetical protein Z945_3793 [Sulfitobacter noctilucae]|nr:hypothetical protein Z945_3793 [Sulfitobacter noctilucae]
MSFDDHPVGQFLSWLVVLIVLLKLLVCLGLLSLSSIPAWYRVFLIS